MEHGLHTIKSFHKRTLHYSGPYRPPPEWTWRAFVTKDERDSLSCIVENYEAMKPEGYEDVAFWLQETAKSLTKWLDNNSATFQFKCACKWWQEMLFFDPLTAAKAVPKDMPENEKVLIRAIHLPEYSVSTTGYLKYEIQNGELLEPLFLWSDGLEHGYVEHFKNDQYPVEIQAFILEAHKEWDEKREKKPPEDQE